MIVISILKTKQVLLNNRYKKQTGVKMPNRINQRAVTQSNKKKTNIVRVVCCFSNEVLAPHDPQKVSYHHHGKEVIGFKYEYLLKVISGRTYFPELPRTKAKHFDIVEYLNKTRDILNDPKKLDSKRKTNTLRKITMFLDQTGLSRYVGGTAEFVRLGLTPTPLLPEPELIPKKFREKQKK